MSKTKRSSRVRKKAPSSRQKVILGWGKRALLVVALIVLGVFVILPLVLVPIYRFVPPPFTTVMMSNLLKDGWPQRDWVSLEEISTHLQYAVMMSEDGQFCRHGGVDWGQVKEAVADWREGEAPRGASTITMQTAKNLFLPPNRSYIRKALEVPMSYYIELWWPKRRIMEVYLNSVEWDVGVYGAESAARHYFGVSAADLSPVQGARLAAILPNPRGRNAAAPGPTVRALSRKALERARAAGAYVGCLQ